MPEPIRHSLVDAEALGAVLADVTVLDVRWALGRHDGPAQYAAGHVPGASYVDLETDLAAAPADPVDARGRHPLPDARDFEGAMRRCGVRADRTVVVYDDWSSLAATRAWWLLVHHGHPDVQVLDGGWSAWQQAGGEVEAGLGGSSAPVGDFAAVAGHLPVVDAQGAGRLAARGGLLDARAPERFAGWTEPVDPVAGHVPGARNVPAAENLRDGRFRCTAELAARYPGAEERELGVYCGSGVSATHDVFALHLLGRSAALFPGSWSGWVSDPRRPVSRAPRNSAGNFTPPDA